MRWLFFIIILSTLINKYSWASQAKANLPTSFTPLILAEIKPFYSPSEGQIEDLLKGEVISVGTVGSPTKLEQQMMLFASGIHPRNCTRAMRKLSLYENYSQYMDFIKKSSYDDKTQRISLYVEHMLMPYSLIVEFKIPRITGPGVYPFTFESGFLKGLDGKIIVKEIGKFCFLGLKADWRGSESKVPNLVLGTFVQTVGKLGIEHLIRISVF